MLYAPPWDATLQRLGRELPDFAGLSGIDRQDIWLLSGAVAGLLLFWLLLRLRRRWRALARRQPRRHEGPLHPVFDETPRSLAPTAIADLAWDGPASYSPRQLGGDPDDPVQAYDFEDEQPGSEAITVTEADPLAEASIFIMYGYHDRAAELLRWYLDDAGEAQAKVLQLLRDAYLQLKQADDYADILERLLILTGPSEEHRQALLKGLQIDPENLQLRVLAINYFGLDVDQINTLLGLEPVTPAYSQDESRLDANPAPVKGQDSRMAAALAQPAGPPRLVEGQIPIAPLSQTEKLVVRSFLPPAQAAKLHLAMHNHNEAIAALHRALNKQPNALVHFTELLKIHQLRRDIGEYARTLWHLFAALGSAGQSLKDRMLSQGFSLGSHPLFEALAQAKERSQIEAIGRRFGFHAADALAPQKPLLVKVAGTAKAADERPEDDIMQEVDSYLEFGQIEQAVKALELAILAAPAAVDLYPPLLELYDRMDDLVRLTELAAGIKRRVQRPPEEVVAMMTNLFQRMKNRREQLAA